MEPNRSYKIWIKSGLPHGVALLAGMFKAFMRAFGCYGRGASKQSYRRILVTDWVRRQRFELAI